MSHLEIKQLYNHKRGLNNGLDFICFMIYLPLGIILFICRLVIALVIGILGCVLPNTEVVHSVLFKLICLSLGISVTVKNGNKKEDVEVYVSNCLSHFDHLAVHSAAGAVMPGKVLNTVLSKAFGMYDFGSSANMETFRKNVTLLITENKIPVYFRPEAKITNGRALLKFKTYPFNLVTNVQPICIEISRPFFNISVSTLGSYYWSNVFFFMFCPCTIYTLEFLPVLERKTLQDDEFAEIVRQNIATALKIPLSEFASSDLIEWEKRYNIEQQNRNVQRVNTNIHNFPNMQQMMLQVREVLPHVPREVIYKDLLKTRSVDHTISNILEGNVRFVPEIPQAASTSTKSTNTSPQVTPSTSGTSSPLITAAHRFGKSAHERNMSFQERKKLLIENARKRYIEKHNLNMALNNC